jgi:hypothetical protein
MARMCISSLKTLRGSSVTGLPLTSRALLSLTVCPALGEELGAPTFQGWEGGPFGFCHLLTSKGAGGGIVAFNAVRLPFVAPDMFATTPPPTKIALGSGLVPTPLPILAVTEFLSLLSPHHPFPGGRPHPSSGKNRSWLPRSAGAPRPYIPEPTEGPHIPSCRGGERVFTPRRPLGPCSWVWVVGSAPSHSLPGRSRDGSIPFGMRRGPPRAHTPSGPSRLDPGGCSPGRRPWGNGADGLLLLSG